jgi:hypothetical protein
MKKYFVFIIFMVVFVSSVSHGQVPLDSDFSYQGELQFNNSPANGVFDFQFAVFDADVSGAQLAQTINEDVSVNQGVFTTIINFGTTVFLGDKVWLEIRIREGSNTGGFQQLLPRQQITSSPYAIHAQFVGANAVSDIEILDGSITTADLADNSVTASKIATDAVGVDEISTNSVGASEIINTEVQSRIVDSCPNGSNVQGVNVDGTVNCQVDNDTTNTYTAGTGLSVSANNVFSLITNGVTSIEIADGAVGTTQVAVNAIGVAQTKTSEVQSRIMGTCTNGAISQVNEDGTVSCIDFVMVEQLPFASSAIVNAVQQKQINKWINIPLQKWVRCYQLTADGATSNKFHTNCDNLGASVTFYLKADGRIFGGYTENSWSALASGTGHFRGYDQAFIFVLVPTVEKFYVGQEYHRTAYSHISYGPTFGSGHDIYINSAMQLGYCNFPYAYTCDQRTQNGVFGGPSEDCTQRLCGIPVGDNTNVNEVLSEIEVWVKQD